MALGGDWRDQNLRDLPPNGSEPATGFDIPSNEQIDQNPGWPGEFELVPELLD